MEVLKPDKPDKPQYLPIGKLTATLTPVKIVEKPAETPPDTMPDLVALYELAKFESTTSKIGEQNE